VCHDRSGRDNGTVANGQTLSNDRPKPDVGVVADLNVPSDVGARL
jgi:hypothetical protein